MKCLASHFFPLAGSRPPELGLPVPAKHSLIFRSLQLALSLFASIDAYSSKQGDIALGSGYDPDLGHLIDCGTLKIYNHADFKRLRYAKGFSNQLIVREFVETSRVGFSESPGKSGSLFFYSSSGHFIVKQMKKSEIDLFGRIAPDYCTYMCGCASFIVNYYAVFKITIGREAYYFTIMDNVFRGKQLMSRYDIKGSTVNRHAGDKASIYKDLDLHRVFRIGFAERYKFGSQIEKDVTRLAQWRFLDYSMIIGVFSGIRPEKTTCHSYQTAPSEYIYIAVIDIFTAYTFVKSAERAFKSILYDVDEISAQNPENYGRRFLIKMLNIFTE